MSPSYVQTSPPPPPIGPAASDRGRIAPTRYGLYFFLAAMGLAADLATKEWIFWKLGMPGEQPIWWIIPDVFGFQTSLNEGALFGLGQGWSLMFASISILFTVGVMAWLFLLGAAHSRFLTCTMALITAGILGNLYDRLGLHGLRWPETTATHLVGEPVYAVRDWILVMIGRWPWPNFNIADSLLVCGVSLLLLQALFFAESEAVTAKGPAESTS